VAKRGRSTGTPAEQRQEPPATPASRAQGRPVLHGLLDDIKANPDDDALRLILADWLEEQGDPRGEHIRLQVQLSRMEEDDPDREALAVRIWEVERPQRDEWLGPLAGLGQGCRLAGGLVQVACEAETFRGSTLEAAITAESRAWLEGLTLDLRGATQEAIVRAVGSPNLACFSALTLQTPSLRYDDASLARWSGGLRALAVSPHLDALKELNLAGARVGLDGLRVLLSSRHLGGLRSLDLSENELDAAGSEALARSPLFGQLVHLNLSHNRMAPGVVEALARSGNGGVLRTLNLYKTDLDDASVRILAESPLLEQCTRLGLAQNHFGAKGLKALADSRHVSCLIHLGLSLRNDRFPVGLQTLCESPNLPNLTSLTLGHGWELRADPRRDGALQLLAPSPLFARLERLNLARLEHDIHGLKALGTALGRSRLRFLNLSGGRIQATLLQALAEGFESSALVSLELGGNGLEDSGAQVLSRQPLPYLRRLGLGFNHMSSTGVALLASSGALRELSYLDLGGNFAHRGGVLALTRASLEKLTRLKLCSCTLDTRDVQALSHAAWAAGLGYLDLGQNPLRDNAVKAVAASPFLARLRWLGLQSTRLTSAGALALAELPHLERLEVLDLRHNRLSKKAVEALRQRFGARVLL
jgi:uncharacterized protein (TIGR02996 family)